MIILFDRSSDHSTRLKMFGVFLLISITLVVITQQLLPFLKQQTAHTQDASSTIIDPSGKLYKLK
ncbi:MAG: hypothetical protein WBZ20_03280 [Nitrososphaeraceae archaeon]